MLRFLTGCVFIATLSVAGSLYKIKYDTRGLQREAMSLRREIVDEQRQLQILKAEWSYLTRPAQIDKFASTLELKPLKPQQILSFRDLDQLPSKPNNRLASLRKISSVIEQKQKEQDDEMNELFSPVLFEKDAGAGMQDFSDNSRALGLAERGLRDE